MPPPPQSGSSTPQPQSQPSFVPKYIGLHVHPPVHCDVSNWQPAVHPSVPPSNPSPIVVQSLFPRSAPSHSSKPSITPSPHTGLSRHSVTALQSVHAQPSR